MNISIKDFDVEMEIRNKGIELEVYTPQGEHTGDLVITKTALIWCKGRTRRANGIHRTWTEFIDWIETP